MSLSVVVTTSNEAENLNRCLTSIREIADEIIVFDLSSSDDSAKVGRTFGAKIISHPHVDYVEKVRNESIRAAQSEWVLLLDPDEIVSPALAEKIKKLIQDKNISAYNFPRKNIFWGTWISHTNFWPDRQIRLFQKDKICWPERIHTYPVIDGTTVDLPATPNEAILHYGYDGLVQFYDRQNRYSSVEAENPSQTKKFSLAKIFLGRYIKHLGFLDGYSGLFLVYNLMITQISTSVKLWERSHSG